jgi:hypothetical protein
MADHLAYGVGVINSEILVEPPRELPPSPRTPPPGVSLQDYHTRAPHRAVEVDGSITVNFPETFAELRPCNPSLSICVAEPPFYQLYQHQQQDSRASPLDWVEIPEKLQPPELRVHRCHHNRTHKLGANETTPIECLHGWQRARAASYAIQYLAKPASP